jgi:hypothetical protein
MENYPKIRATIKKREDPFVRRQQTDATPLKTFNTVNRDHHRHQGYSKL